MQIKIELELHLMLQEHCLIDREWDALFRNKEFPLDAIELLKSAGDKLTLNSSNCILREAAREIKSWGRAENTKTPLADAIGCIQLS